MRNSSDLRAALALIALAATATNAGCSTPAAEDAVPVGLLLSYTGSNAASTINSERALTLAFEAANAAGGVGGRPVRAIARDTGSDPGIALTQAQQLLGAGAALVIGPDTNELAIATRSLLGDRTLILPSFATAAATDYKTPSWIVMGVTIGRVACELMAQMRADGRASPLLVYNPTGYNSALAWNLSLRYGVPKIVLPPDDPSSSATLKLIAQQQADAFVLAADPPSAIPLVYELLATSGITDPSRWYLSPTLHSPILIDSVPRGVLVGARGVAQGSDADGPAFADAFASRWHEPPLDDAYLFYDAGALAALALQHALTKTGTIPTDAELSKHVIAVTSGGGVSVAWNQLPQGLAHLRNGEEITYQGVSGAFQFDAAGYAKGALTSWWTIGPAGFAPNPGKGDCQ